MFKRTGAFLVQSKINDKHVVTRLMLIDNPSLIDSNLLVRYSIPSLARIAGIGSSDVLS